MKIIITFFCLIVLTAFVDVSHAAESHHKAEVITNNVDQEQFGSIKKIVEECHTDTSRLISNVDESEANEEHETCVAVPGEPVASGNRVQRVDAQDDDPCGPGVWARTTKIVEGSGDGNDASCADRLPAKKAAPAN